MIILRLYMASVTDAGAFLLHRVIAGTIITNSTKPLLAVYIIGIVLTP
jgi:hypothetical protein